MDNKEGRPEITEDEKKEMLQKLEPYLKSGISVRKALKEAQIPNSTFYKLMERDEQFREQIDRFKQFISIILNNSIIRHLHTIVAKQTPKEGEAEELLTKEDMEFLKWFATNSNLTKEEYGERKDIGIVDPESEIHRISGLIEELTDGKKNEPSK
jgi:hypothetical protein